MINAPSAIRKGLAAVPIVEVHILFQIDKRPPSDLALLIKVAYGACPLIGGTPSISSPKDWKKTDCRCATSL